MEKWKSINNFKDYEVSNLGRIRSLKKDVLIMSASLDGRGYLKLSLFKEGIRKTITVHRVVCQAFHPNPENKDTVNHKNGKKDDNRAVNLEWATQKENIKHAFESGLVVRGKGKDCFHYGKRGGKTNRAKKVRHIESGKIYDCLKDCFEFTGFSYKNASRQLNGERSNRTGFEYL